MQEIESELKNQREKIRLLEQGLLTGIAPEDLKHKNGGGPAKATSLEDLLLSDQKSKSDILQKPKLDDADLSKDKSVVPGNKVSDAGDGIVQERMAKAKEKYQSGKFLQAASDFSSINREFGDNAAQGDVKYWLGKSYMGTKDFSAAKIEYDAYVKGWPSAENIGRARIDLAKCLRALGLKERARAELQRVLKDFDGQEVAEIAAYELQTLQGAL
jgi:TolA-binding protein